MTKDRKQPVVCFIADGDSVHTRRWVLETANRGFDVFLITRRKPACLYCKTYVVFPGMGVLGWLLGILKIRGLIQSLKPDIVHGHYVTSYGLWAALAGKRELVITAWGSDILVSPAQSVVKRILTRYVLKKALLVTADSENVLREISSYRTKAKLEQIQWGVDMDAIPFMEHGALEVFNVLSLRTLSPNYNIDLIIRAFSVFLNALPNARAVLHVVGEGESSESLRKLVAQFGLEKNVVFYGFISEDELISCLKMASISVTVPTSDATSMSLLESMAAGLPIIGSDIEANRQWITSEGGVLVEVGNIQALADAMVRLWGSSSERISMGKFNRNLVQEKASRNGEMNRMAVLYRDMI